jgi:hypothetical protein
MRNLSIKDHDIAGGKVISIDFYKPRLITLTSGEVAPDINIYYVTKEELEYMASELKRIADSMED